jgi:DNA-binding NarL/FixJ family response regulator
VEGNPLYREGARLALARGGCEVVGEASVAAGALELAARLRPDVVLMDSRLSGASTLRATRRLSDVAPASRVIILAEPRDEDAVMAGLAAGASGYLSKRASLVQVVDAVRAAHAGEVPVSPDIAANLVLRLRNDLRQRLDADSLDAVLSEREIDVLRLLSQGLDNAAIARELSVSPATVKKHVSNILVKLGLRNRVQAAIYAVLIGTRSMMPLFIGTTDLN